MVEIGSAYERTKSMLIEKINDPKTLNLMIIEMVSDHQRCYFCHRNVPVGDKIFELTHYTVTRRRNTQETYYVDEICMGLARSGNNKNSARV
ncbi:MAG: hypothetical protein KKF50_05230 [Nanoarchaeota archaeon]|nr:hypothetical protein [Nanoarchaeota archaeon]